MVRGFLIIICLLFIQPSSTRAGDEAYLYHLSQKPAGLNVQENTLIGYPQRYIVKDNDTLLDIARKFNLGFSEMKLMHKEIDPWIPPKGLELVIPTQWVLPEGNWFSPHSPRFHKMPWFEDAAWSIWKTIRSSTGNETALWLAQQGYKVTIVEMLPKPMGAGIPVPHPNKTMLLDLLNFHKVDILTNTSLLAVTNDGVELIDTSFRRSKLPAGNVVLAVGLEPDQTLFRSLMGKIPNVYLIGDSKKPRNIMQAIWDAYEVTRNV